MKFLLTLMLLLLPAQSFAYSCYAWVRCYPGYVLSCEVYGTPWDPCYSTATSQYVFCQGKDPYGFPQSFYFTCSYAGKNE